jgi:hypothetical protein
MMNHEFWIVEVMFAKSYQKFRMVESINLDKVYQNSKTTKTGKLESGFIVFGTRLEIDGLVLRPCIDSVLQDLNIPSSDLNKYYIRADVAQIPTADWHSNISVIG